MIRIPVLDFIFRPGREEEEEELAARLSCCGGSDSASMSDLIVVDADDWTLPPPDFQHPLTSFAVGWGIKYQQNQNQQLHESCPPSFILILLYQRNHQLTLN